MLVLSRSKEILTETRDLGKESKKRKREIASGPLLRKTWKGDPKCDFCGRFLEMSNRQLVTESHWQTFRDGRLFTSCDPCSDQLLTTDAPTAG
jgi:hypothetical protein